jgi:apolipoprotein N-acyltransferase
VISGLVGRLRGFSWRARGVDLLAGAGVALAQAPLLLWWVAFPALCWAVARMAASREAGRTGAFVGAGYFGVYLNWIVAPFFVDPWVHGWMAPFAFVLTGFGLGLFWALASGGAAWLAGRFGVARVWVLVVALGLVEMVRGHVFTGFPWAQPGHLWLGSPGEQAFALIGATGVTVVTLALAGAVVAWRSRGAVAAAVVVAAAMGWGWVRVSAPGPEGRAVSLRLVQPNAEQHLKWDPEQARVLFDRQLALTAEGEPADLTIWPETAVPYLLEYSPEVAGIIAEASGGRPVAVGIQRVEGERGWNSLRVIGNGGAVTASYDKHHLVPFGEYMPFGDALYRWFGIEAFAAQLGRAYSAGEGPAVLDLGQGIGRVVPLICYEAVFPAIPRAVARPDWMLQVTNDAWFGTWTGPFQHFQQARVRAIEMGLPLVRVANTGVTAVIGARGEVAARLPFGVAGKLDVAEVPGALAATPYARWGDLAAWLLLAGLCGAAIAGRRGKSA